MKTRLLIASISLFIITQRACAQWIQQTSNTAANLTGIHCTDVNHCFTAGATGNIRKTSNGGTAWTVVSSGTFTNMSSVKMYDTTKIWIGMVNGTFRYSSTGGTSWSTVVPATTPHVIYDIFFHNATDYIAVGGDAANQLSGGNVAITTTDAGTTWTAQNFSGVPTMLGIHCFDASTCVAGAGAETIYKTTDGGVTWNVKHSGTTVILYDINFPSSTVGYAVGGDPSASTSMALKTTDAGETWNALPLVAPNVIYGTHFTSIDTGYVVGKGGFIVKTMDGGLTWGTQVSPVSTDLNKIFFSISSTGYISGAGGVILKTTNAGGVVTGTGENNSENLFSIFGNPSHNEMKIETKFVMQHAELTVFNELGQLQNTRKNISGNAISVATSDFPNGIYFFRVQDDDRCVSGKFVVE